MFFSSLPNRCSSLPPLPHPSSSSSCWVWFYSGGRAYVTWASPRVVPHVALLRLYTDKLLTQIHQTLGKSFIAKLRVFKKKNPLSLSRITSCSIRFTSYFHLVNELYFHYPSIENGFGVPTY